MALVSFDGFNNVPGLLVDSRQVAFLCEVFCQA